MSITKRQLYALLFSFLTALPVVLQEETYGAEKSSAAVIREGRFTPLFGLDKDQAFLPVAAFKIDRYPVTNQQFQEFVKNNPHWNPDKVPALLAEPEYLQHWKSPKSPSPRQRNRPVVFVSWHAADAYCEWKGGRLPTVLEWEYVAAASETKADASRDPEFIAKILRWYERPSTQELPPVGKGKPNYWGVYDMHGLVWEWTSDFNSVFVTGDNRQDGDKLQDRFCGFGATDAATRDNYAAFMRYAMRSSLRAHYSTVNLGFRCAYDITTETRSITK